jgi:hypothetical protein
MKMCNCEKINARLQAVIKRRDGLLSFYETLLDDKRKVEKEIETFQDEANMVKWKTAQNVILEKNEDGKPKHSNQELRDIAVELSLRQNEGFSQLKQGLASKKAELDKIKDNLDITPRRLKAASEDLEALKLWRD